MPTPKRERKREGQRARQAAEAQARKRAAQRRRLVGVAVIVSLVAVTAAAFGLLGGDDETEVTTSTSTTRLPRRATPAEVEEGGVEGKAELRPVPAGRELTGDTPCPPADGSAERTSRFAKPPPTCIDPAKSYRANVTTTKGSFVITLDPARAPKTVNNFVVLARYHYFDGIPFHRIIPDFVVQGGDPEASGRGGPGYQFEDELPEPGDYEEGSLAMANSGPDTNGSQFFIVVSATGAQTLVQAVGGEAKYSLFGQVTSGMEVVKAIEAVGSPDGTPKEVVKMESVTIEEA